MQPQRNVRELRGLQGRPACIQRFISNLSGRCQPFTKLMKKGVSFIWDDACHQAFEEIKRYLMHPPVITAPVSGKSFLIYVRVMDHSLGALLAQNNEQWYEQAIYYLSRTMIGAKHQYNLTEKECLVLAFAAQKMRHYLVDQTINVISKINLLRLLMTKPSSLNGDWQNGQCYSPNMRCNSCHKKLWRDGGGRFFDWASRPKDNQILWKSSWWGCWSLLDPDDFWRTGMVTLLRRPIENIPSRKYHSKSGGSTYLPIELCNPLRILINWAMLQQCKGIQCSLDRDANRWWDWH